MSQKPEARSRKQEAGSHSLSAFRFPLPAFRFPTAAFTIIELMVVLAVLAILMGITIGSLVTSGRHNRLLAVEHLVGDFIRQARHTARSSGSPVILEISKTNRTISGVSRICLWSEMFEGEATEHGQTGHGLLRNTDTTLDPAAPRATLDRLDRLVRPSSPTRTEGFYISCAVRPPLAPSTPTYLPLMLIGDTADESSSVCGLVLESTTVTSGSPPASTSAWNAVGWIRKNGDSNTTVLKGKADVGIGPITGDRWEELGLLYDGQRLVLYRNGQRVNELILVDTTAANAASLPVPLAKATDEKIFIGQSDDGGGLVNCGAVIDDARVYRLSTDQLGTLPRGVTAKDDYRIVCHPDGRVEVNYIQRVIDIAADPTKTYEDPTNLTFEGDFANTGNIGTATVTVSIDGHVTSKVNPQ